jgi:hypothetical protein
MSGAAEQSATRGTVRPALGPVSHLQASLGLPDLVRLNTILCSVTNSCALIRCPALQFGSDHKHILCSDRMIRLNIHVRSVLDVDSDCMLVVCTQIPLYYPITKVSGCEPST